MPSMQVRPHIAVNGETEKRRRMSQLNIRSTLLRGLSAMAAEVGFDADKAMQQAGISWSVLNDDWGFVHVEQMQKLLAHLQTATSCQTPGLVLATHCANSLSGWQVLEVLGQKPQTAGRWIASLCRALKCWTNILEYSFSTGAARGVRSLRITVHSADMDPQLHEFATALIASLVANHIQSLHPLQVHFQHDAYTGMKLYRTVLGGDILFHHLYNEITFDEDSLAQDFLKSGQHLVDRNFCESEPLALQTQRIIEATLSTGQCNADFASALMDLHPKRLQRALSNEGTSFTKILTRVRSELALRLLRNPVIPISQVAANLDYAHTAPFTTAFRRWHDMSPQAWRDKNLER